MHKSYPVKDGNLTRHQRSNSSNSLHCHQVSWAKTHKTSLILNLQKMRRSLKMLILKLASQHFWNTSKNGSLNVSVTISAPRSPVCLNFLKTRSTYGTLRASQWSRSQPTPPITSYTPSQPLWNKKRATWEWWLTKTASTRMSYSRASGTTSIHHWKWMSLKKLDSQW